MKKKIIFSILMMLFLSCVNIVYAQQLIASWPQLNSVNPTGGHPNAAIAKHEKMVAAPTMSWQDKLDSFNDWFCVYGKETGLIAAKQGMFTGSLVDGEVPSENANDYITFSFTVPDGYKLSLTKFIMPGLRDETKLNYHLRASIDGYKRDLITSVIKDDGSPVEQKYVALPSTHDGYFGPDNRNFFDYTSNILLQNIAPGTVFDVRLYFANANSKWVYFFSRSIGSESYFPNYSAYMIVFEGSLNDQTPPTSANFTPNPGPVQDVVFTVSSSDIAYADAENNPMDHILITSIPASGVLYTDHNGSDNYDTGEELGVDSLVTKANIDAGNLQFIINSSENTSFKFKVHDSCQYSTNEYTATLNMNSSGTAGLWTGATNNDWHTTTNWSDGSIPTSATDVTIPAGKTAEIAPGTSASCNNISIDATGSLTIQSSSATNAGSLIVAGTATGNLTFQSYLSETGKWHVVAAPVASQNIWSFATLAGNSIAANAGKRAVTEYNEGTNTWDTNYPTSDTEGSFGAGSGYTVLRSAAGLVAYTGTLNTSDVSKPLTRTLYGWNALGNPYTSAINATVSAHATNNLITANTGNFDPSFAALYLWDAATNTYVTINNTGTGSLVQNYIQAGQGFFVRAKDNTGLNFSITEAMQTHQTSIPLKSGETAWPTIQLAVRAKAKQSSTVVAFNNQMTNGLDITYDAGMFKADKNFALYSRLVDDNGVDFAIQALPENYNKLVVPLGIDVPADTEITFTAETMNLPADAAVYLEDRAAKTITQLDLTGAGYTVTITDKTKGTGNFFLHTSSATTAVNELENNLKVYTRDRAIYISGNLETTDVVAVYSIVGKLHYKKTAEKTGLLRIDSSKMPAGIYLVNISRNNTNSTQKVIISE
jgi:hypothetical protein